MAAVKVVYMVRAGGRKKHSWLVRYLPLLHLHHRRLVSWTLGHLDTHLSMIDVANGTNVYVRLRPFKDSICTSEVKSMANILLGTHSKV